MAISDRVVVAALLAIGKLSQALSAKGRSGLGRLLGNAMVSASARRKKITQSNVQYAFPERSVQEREAIVRGAYHNLGITLAEILALPAMTREDVMRSVRFENIDILRKRVQNRQPTILISGHYGNWELLALAGALHAGGAFTIVMHPQRNQRVAAILNSYRTRFGNTVVSMHDAARTLVRTINEGGTIAFLVDQHADSEKDAWIEFMGRAAPTYEAPAALALRYNVPIITGFAERLTDGTYAAPLHELPMQDLENNAAGIRELTQRHVRALEIAVRAHPELWSWQHRRWRDEVR